MKQLIIGILVLVATGTAAQVKIRHGLLMGTGKGSVNGAEYAVDDKVWNGVTKLQSAGSKYKYNAILGYKVRLEPSGSKSFFDMDMTFCEKKIMYSIFPDGKEMESMTPGESTNLPLFLYGEYRSYSIALALGFGYRLYRGLYVGAGAELTYRYRTEITRPSLKNGFDIPLFVKAGYDFGFIDLSFSYKMGMTGMFEDSRYIKNGKVNDWQLQLFIPIF